MNGRTEHGSRRSPVATWSVVAIVVVVAIAVVNQLQPAGAAPAITEGLVAGWSFDDAAGQVAADAAGGTSDAVLGATSATEVTDPVWDVGLSGTGLRLDGLDDYATVLDGPGVQPASELTVSAWVNVDALGGRQVVVDKRVLGSADGYLLGISGTEGLFCVAELGTECVAGGGVTAGTWHHLAGTYDGADMTLYVDAVLVASAPNTNPLAHAAFPVLLGVEDQGGTLTSHFGGLIDEVHLHDRALAGAEVATLADATLLHQAPSVDAGANQVIVAPDDSVTLGGVVSDDGLPDPPGGVTTAWSMVSGPAPVTFGDPTSLSTTATFSAPGSYVLQLFADDGDLQTTDEVTVDVFLTPPPNETPSVDAGLDQTIVLPVASVTLVGVVSDDGFPDPPAAVTTTWTQVTGPGVVAFSDPVAAATTATFPQEGSYTLRLTADDGELATADELTVTVEPPGIVTGLVAGWWLDEGAGQVIGDFTGGGAEGVLGADATIEAIDPVGDVGLAGAALRFDGVDDVATVAPVANVEPAAAITVAAWVNLDDLGGRQVAVGKRVVGGADSYLLGAIDGAALFCAAELGTECVIGGSLTAATWHHVAGTYNGDVMSVYLDGVLVASAPNTNPLVYGVFPLVLGAEDQGGALTAHMAGLIEEPRIFDTALDVAAIAQLAVPPATNQPPAVDAGADLVIVAPDDSMTLAGVVSDDGLPDPPGVVTTAWSMVSGPAPVTFADPASVTTTATFSAAGIYVVQFTADDGAVQRSDEATVVVFDAAPGNQAPVVSAGADQAITVPATVVTLDGSALDDGLPSPPTLTTTWTMVSGPGAVVFADPAAQSTTATLTVEGTYVLRVSAFDGALTSSDDVNVELGSGGVSGSFDEQLVTSGLGVATSMAFTPDGRLFVTEQAGALRVIENGVLLSTPFLAVPVDSSGERGLLGVAFDPSFETTGYLYVYYSTAGSPMSRVSRFTQSSSDPNVAEPGSELVVLDGIPSVNLNHNGGALHFGVDGMLYLAVGDDQVATSAQDLGALTGKLLRIDPTNHPAIIPADNPFVGTPGAREEIWALGLRNPFTFAIDPLSGATRINDVGQTLWEEVNDGVAGGNYGWPTCEGACGDPAFIDPLHAYSHGGEQAAVTGATFYRGSSYPSVFAGSYFFADYLRGFIKRITPSGEVTDFLSGLDSPVDLDVGPDGDLYYLSVFSGGVSRIVYTPSGNRSPVAVATADPTAGAAPLDVSFDAGASTDPDGDPMSFQWDFGDGSPAVAGATAAHTYAASGAYQATVTVTDGQGGQDVAVVDVVVGDPPVPVIVVPDVSATYRGGETIAYSGSATDALGVPLDPESFSWTITFQHHEHEHPFLGPIDDVSSGSFVVPAVPHAPGDDDVWYRIHLTVTDAAGVPATVTRDIFPETSTVTYTTDPAGIEMTIEGQPFTTPHSIVDVVGTVNELSAPPTAEVGGVIYEFDSWSDGGAPTHGIVTPGADQTFVATYQESATVVDESFDGGVGLFGFVDDVLATSAPGYADGLFVGGGGFVGGGVSVSLGGVDSASVLGMSGGWERLFVVGALSDVTVSVRFDLSQSASYEADEFSRVVVLLDGVALGVGGVVAEVVGDGNGGGPISTGWQVFEATVVGVPAGSHTLTLAGFNNKKTFSNEVTTVVFDDVVVTAVAAA